VEDLPDDLGYGRQELAVEEGTHVVEVELVFLLGEEGGVLSADVLEEELGDEVGPVAGGHLEQGRLKFCGEVIELLRGEGAVLVLSL
jgi:hypothetical protein